MKLTKSMTGMKIQGNRYYVSIDDGDKVVDGAVFADGRDLVVERKVVSGERWVEVTKDELVAIVTEAKGLGIVCDPSKSSPDAVVRCFDWSKAKTQEEIIAELKEENENLIAKLEESRKVAKSWEYDHDLLEARCKLLKTKNEALAIEVEEWEAMGVTPKAHMDALDELRETMAAEYAQRMKEQAAQHAEEVAELEEALRFWRGSGLATIEDMQGELF